MVAINLIRPPAQQKLSDLLKTSEHAMEIPNELVPECDDIVLEQRHTLSGFNKTDLHQYLQTHHIEHVIAVGPFANLALDSTIRDGVQLGYHLTVIQDCISAETEEALNSFQISIPRYAQTNINLAKFESILNQS